MKGKGDMEKGIRLEFVFKAVFFTLLASLFLSCPSHISEEFFLQVKDETPPLISVIAPVEGDAYGAFTMVSGTVTDSDGAVSSLSVEIVGIRDAQPVPLDSDGGFSAILETSGVGYSGDIVLKLVALDWNSNYTETSLALRKIEGGIVSFSVTAGNKQSEIEWSLLPGEAVYTIQELRSGISRTGIAESPYIWTDLENGNLYSFRLKAEVGDNVYFSSIEEAIPLASTTLMVRSEQIYRGVELSWKGISAASEYVVERAAESGGPYFIRTITADTSFTDEGLEKDDQYYYRVYPEEMMNRPDIIYSTSVYTSAGFFPSVSDPFFGSLDTPGQARNIVLSGNWAYIADYNEGLQIIDISDPGNPSLVKTWETDSYTYDVELSGNYAYLADGSSGLQILDITDPSSPVPAGSYEAAQSAQGVTLSGNYAYIAAYYSGLYIIDISSPGTPSFISTWWDSDLLSIYDVSVSGNYAYLSHSGNNILPVIELTVLETPVRVNTYAMHGSVTINGNNLYISGGTSGLQIVDITNPEAIVDVGACDTPPGAAVSSAISGEYGYVADRDNGLQIIDITDKSAPVVVKTIDTPSESLGVAVAGDYAYIADYGSGLQVSDITIPREPILLPGGVCDTSGYADKIAHSGNYLYIADGTSGLQIIDITDPAAPVIVGAFDTNKALDVAVAGDYAYIGDYSEFIIVNISDPANPVLVSTVDTPGRPYGLCLWSDYVFVADSSNLLVIDVSDPEFPFIVGICDTPGSSQDVFVSGDYACVVDIFSHALHVVDISDPQNPLLTGTYTAPDSALAVAIAGSYAYVAAGTSGLLIIDIANPLAPSLEGSYNTPAYAADVFVAGDFAWVADSDSGLQIIDVSDPTSPVLTGSFDTEGYPKGVVVSEDYAFITDWAEGLKIIDLWP